jgi:hypothetical protein
MKSRVAAAAAMRGAKRWCVMSGLPILAVLNPGDAAAAFH